MLFTTFAQDLEPKHGVIVVLVVDFFDRRILDREYGVHYNVIISFLLVLLILLVPLCPRIKSCYNWTIRFMMVLSGIFEFWYHFGEEDNSAWYI